MKINRCFCSIALSFIFVFLGACGKTHTEALPAPTGTPATATPDPADRDTSTPPPLDEAESPASATDLRPQAEDSSTDTANMLAVYESDLGFRLQIPRSWMHAAAAESGSAVEQLYAAEETENAVRFYDIANAEAGFGGTLVTIRLFALGESYDFLPDFELLAETEAGSYVAVFPTDVQADPGSDGLPARYQAMAEGLRSALAEGFSVK